MLQCFVEKLFHINWTQFIGLAFGAGVIIIDVSFVNFLFKQMVLTIDFKTQSDNRKRALQVFQHYCQIRLMTTSINLNILKQKEKYPSRSIKPFYTKAV